ncbi:hypothetical protein SISNIDRAFT_551208 [Sistotremastrum niveocremeum HHB9708]|uniref:Uncharacterized protein n=1 Tax=Sistotremastrum niveocremeum HHB9708 TaxID=1314777 RepID=A0A164S2L3_9AGAM|nr:hypothetical protein SISNIDRAFT_551208 [Sistotremastrum niveocremeum HHB9708]
MRPGRHSSEIWRKTRLLTLHPTGHTTQYFARSETKSNKNEEKTTKKEQPTASSTRQDDVHASNPPPPLPILGVPQTSSHAATSSKAPLAAPASSAAGKPTSLPSSILHSASLIPPSVLSITDIHATAPGAVLPGPLSTVIPTFGNVPPMSSSAYHLTSPIVVSIPSSTPSFQTHSASPTHAPTASSHSSGSSIALIVAGAVAALGVLTVAIFVIRRLFTNRKRARDSAQNFSPALGLPGASSPFWGDDTKDHNLFNNVPHSEKDKNWASLFPEPPRRAPVPAQKSTFAPWHSSPKLPLQISKPQAVVLPDFLTIHQDAAFDQGQAELMKVEMGARVVPQLRVTNSDDPFSSSGSEGTLQYHPQQGKKIALPPSSSKGSNYSESQGITTSSSKGSLGSSSSGPNLAGRGTRIGASRTEPSFAYSQSEKEIAYAVQPVEPMPRLMKPSLKPASTTRKLRTSMSHQPSVPPLQVSKSANYRPTGRKPQRSEEEQRRRETKALTSALGLSSPPTPSMYSPSIAPSSPTRADHSNEPMPGFTMLNKAPETPRLTVASPTMESLSPVGKWMFAEYDDDDRTIGSPSLPYLVQSPSLPSTVLERESSMRRLKVDAKPPRLPSPPPIPSLAQLALATNQPDYRSPTYSIYGLYDAENQEMRKSRRSTMLGDSLIGRRSMFGL